MDRLLYVIAFTTEFEEMKRFYRDQVGLETGQDNPFWVDFRTTGARFALMAVHPGMTKEVELSLHAPHLDETVAALRARGVPFIGDVKRIPFGRVAHLRDPEGNLVSLYAPDQVPDELEGGPRLVALVNAADFAGTTAFYRDTLRLPVADEAEGWIEFETGGTRLAVHRRARGDDHPDHAEPRVVFGVEFPDLDDAAARMRARGLRFSTAPTDADFGPYAEAVDPEGAVVLFREPATEPTLEERLAAPFDDDDTPARIAIRKPVNKQSKAISRIVAKPEYKASRKAAKPKQAAAKAAAAKPKPKVARAASTRGAGPEGARKKPKTTRDVKRAKAKPATGRAKKAAVRAGAGKKRAVARASKARPVKREVSRRGKAVRGSRGKASGRKR